MDATPLLDSFPSWIYPFDLIIKVMGEAAMGDIPTVIRSGMAGPARIASAVPNPVSCDE